MEIGNEEEHKSSEMTNETTTEVPLSKSQKKKIEKLKKLMELRKIQREKQRKNRKLKKQQAREQGIKLSPGPTRKELKRNKVEVEKATYQVVIDLSFDDLMSEKDISSCAAQLLRIYTANRRAKMPIPIHFTSLKEDTKLYKKLESHEGSCYWDVFRHKEPFQELFDREKIVYLSSESENVLDVLEDGMCYIIGGMVDHNQHKGLTEDLAKKQNIKTARLPLAENVKIASRCVLTINQCFEILLGVSEGKSWKEILMEVLPQRKMPKLKPSNENNKMSNDVKDE